MRDPERTALAAQAGISQPRASQILHHLDELQLVHISGHGRWEPDREALLDRFLAEYPGPGGSEQYYYTLGSPGDVAIRAGRVGTPARPIVVSADVGPDLIVPWRRPSLVILYARHAIDPSDLGLTDALGRHDANVIMRNPEDRSIFPTPALLRSLCGDRRSAPVAALTSGQGLSAEAADTRFTRIRALIAHVLGPK
jgi:hypothetical protein